MPVGSVYDRAAEDWDASAGLVYGPLGARLVACSPVGLAGKLVLDAGCGTGAAARAAAARGARAMGIDRSLPMARQGTGHEISMLAGDLLALPFCSNAFDVALAGFVINHVPPAMGLAELVRVVRPGGAVLASTWDSGTSDPVKAVIEEVLRRHGWTAPDWFQSMTATAGTSAGTPPGLAAVARRVGLGEVRATVVHPDLGLRDPGALATYRLSMPHIAEWYATLDAPAKEVVFREAEHAARPLTTSWRPGMVVLTGRVRRQPKRRAARCPSDAA